MFSSSSVSCLVAGFNLSQRVAFRSLMPNTSHAYYPPDWGDTHPLLIAILRQCAFVCRECLVRRVGALRAGSLAATRADGRRLAVGAFAQE